jgi:VCBS repeat-containing protein
MPNSLSPTAEYHWFGTRAVKFENGGSTGAQIERLDDASDFATRTVSGQTNDVTGSEWQQFLAFSATQAELAAFNAANAVGINLADGVDAGTAGRVNSTGDLRVGQGVEAHNIADAAGNGRLVDSSGKLDEADDPLVITGLGKANLAFLDAASMEAADVGNRVVFSNDLGFGLINAMGGENVNNASRLNDGDAVNFAVNDARQLQQASFTVKVLNGGSTKVIIDSDGATIRDTNGAASGGFVQDASAGELDLGTLAHGTKVTIDYQNSTIWFNDAVQFTGETDGFFTQWAANGRNDLTLGSQLGNQTGWSADNLLLVTETAAPVTETALPENNAPTAEGFTGGTGKEDAAIAGAVKGADLDGDALTYAVAAGNGPASGKVEVNAATGEFTYTPKADFNGTDSFTVTIEDGQGGSTTQLVKIEVAAVNDAATFGGSGTGKVSEDGTPGAKGTLTVDDVDAGQAGFASTGALAGLYGDFTFTLASGAWSYALRNDDSNVQALTSGQTVQDTLTITSADGSTTTVTIDIAGLDEPTKAVLADTFGGTGDPDDAPTLPAAPNGSYTNLGDTGTTTVSGSGAQRFDGQGGDDRISTGDGNDGVLGGTGNDTINLGDDNDFGDGGAGGDSVIGSDGNDALLGGDDNDTIVGGDGADSLYGQAGHDAADGGDSNDRIYGGPGNDTLEGGEGGDSLFGGSGNDSIQGEDGNDTITGGYGADVMTGGSGSDLFIFKSANDTNDRITDFTAGKDEIVLTGLGVTGYDAAQGMLFSAANTASSYVSGGDRIVIVDLDGNTADAELVITLSGNPALSSSDFVF